MCPRRRPTPTSRGATSTTRSSCGRPPSRSRPTAGPAGRATPPGSRAGCPSRSSTRSSRPVTARTRRRSRAPSTRSARATCRSWSGSGRASTTTSWRRWRAWASARTSRRRTRRWRSTRSRTPWRRRSDRPTSTSGEAVDAAGLEDHVAVVSAGFGMPIDMARRLVPVEELTIPGFAPFVGYLGDRPVATSLGYTASGTVGVYNVATVEDVRRRGYGAAVTRRAIADGVGRGATVAILQSSDMGRAGLRGHGLPRGARVPGLRGRQTRLTAGARRCSHERRTVRHHRRVTAFDDLLPALDARFERLREETRIPGVAWGVVRDGVLVHAGGAGTIRDGEDRRPDADTVFRIASMTKSFTAAALLLLRDEGRLRLDDPVGDHVPELAGWRPATTDSPPGDDPPADDDVGRASRPTTRGATASRASRSTRSRGCSPPGRRSRGRPGRRSSTRTWATGSSAGSSRAVAGVEYREVVRDRMLAPLGMTSTAYLGRGRPRRPPRPRLRAARRRAHPRGRRPVRGAGVDGRRVLDRPRPRPLGRRLPRRVPGPRRPGGRPPAPPRLAARDAAGPALDPAAAARTARARGAGRRRPRLRVRALRPRGHGARDVDLALGRLPGLRLAHGLAPGDRPRADRRSATCATPRCRPAADEQLRVLVLADAVPRRRVLPSPVVERVPPDRRGAARALGRRGRRRGLRDEHGPRRAAGAAARGGREGRRRARPVPSRRLAPEVSESPAHLRLVAARRARLGPARDPRHPGAATADPAVRGHGRAATRRRR